MTMTIVIPTISIIIYVAIGMYIGWRLVEYALNQYPDVENTMSDYVTFTVLFIGIAAIWPLSLVLYGLAHIMRYVDTKKNDK